MSIKSFAAGLFANHVHRKAQKWIQQPVKTQQRVLESLVEESKRTLFGKDHGFEDIKTHQDFVERVPIRDYEALKPYVEQVVEGRPDILWPGKPVYFAKTSGTTSGAKYIPITAGSIKEQVKASRNAILNYIKETGNTSFVDGKWIFLQGSPELEEKKRD